jgi:hypothetical protein
MRTHSIMLISNELRNSKMVPYLSPKSKPMKKKNFKKKKRNRLIEYNLWQMI